MSDIRFRIAAKTDVGLQRSNNEDNFQVSANLDEQPMKWVNNQEYSLGKKGTLLVVADGMGGMNAGEVASEIAINTVKELFAPEKITDEVVKTRYTIEKFMKGVIVEADKRIKDFSKENPESQGMGTTIVVAWLFDENLYVSWCGDSRAYIYNTTTGLFQISKDHSYVQTLVDQGKLTKDDAFDFPDSNIVTRSLTDSSTKAAPDCLLMPQPLCNGDIIMLCSDGLNGMIRDNEIEAIIAQNQDNLTMCVDSLIQSALDAAGADNCTVVLCQILSGGSESNTNRIPHYSVPVKDGITKPSPIQKKSKKSLWVLAVSIMVCILCGGFWYVNSQNETNNVATEQEDSVSQEKPDTTKIIIEEPVKQDTINSDIDSKPSRIIISSKNISQPKENSNRDEKIQSLEETLGMQVIDAKQESNNNEQTDKNREKSTK